MLQADNPERIMYLASKSLELGADAVGMQFCRMKSEYKTKDTYRKLFESALGHPIYVTNYRDGMNSGKNDDTLAEELLELSELGATLVDVMGDFFAPCECQLTMDEGAVRRQTELIEELHKRGSEVIMSSHVMKFISAEEVLRIAHEQKQRGADIVKIVVSAASAKEEMENLRIAELLRQNLDSPYLFLSGGECRIIRRFGERLGNCMTLCVYEHDELSTKSQPLISEMQTIRRLI